MRFRPLGKTNLKVSEIGLGTWGMGGTSWWGNATDESSLRTIARCLEKSINFIDTAYVYGDGHAEELIGRTLQKSGQTVTVATKVPPKNREWPSRGKAEDAFPEDWLITCTERSLQKLNTDTIDLQQLHVWRDEWLNTDGWKKGVERLKRDGKIRFFGVSIDDHNPDSAVKIVESGLVDTVHQCGKA